MSRHDWFGHRRPRGRRRPGGHGQLTQPVPAGRCGGRGPAGRRGHVRRGVRRGQAGAAVLGRDPGPGARPGDRRDRPDRRGQQGGAGPPGHPRAGQAPRRSAGRSPGDHRHLRLLPRRGTAAVRPDRAQRDAGQAAVHVPGPGRRGGHRDGGQLPGRGAVVVPGPGAGGREHRGVEAGRVRGRVGPGAVRPVPGGRAARRRAEPGVRGRRGDVRGAGAGAAGGHHRQDRVHRVDRDRTAASASSRAVTCRSRAWNWAARTRW